jgi:hypothetical protein
MSNGLFSSSGIDLLDALAAALRPAERRRRIGGSARSGSAVCEVARANAIASSSLLQRTSPQPAHGAVHLRAAHLLERHLLADDHLGHARRAEVHRGVALDHHDDVAERGDVRAARSARAEEQADLRHDAAHLHLVVEDAPGAPPAGEHLDLIGDARPGRVDEVEHRDAELERRLLDAEDLLDRPRPHEPALTVESLAMMATARPDDLRRVPGDDAVGGSSGSRALASAASSTNEPASSEARDPLAREELPGLGVLLVVLGRAPRSTRASVSVSFFVEGRRRDLELCSRGAPAHLPRELDLKGQRGPFRVGQLHFYRVVALRRIAPLEVDVVEVLAVAPVFGAYVIEVQPRRRRPICVAQPIAGRVGHRESDFGRAVPPRDLPLKNPGTDPRTPHRRFHCSYRRWR